MQDAGSGLSRPSHIFSNINSISCSLRARSESALLRLSRYESGKQTSALSRIMDA